MLIDLYFSNYKFGIGMFYDFKDFLPSLFLN